MKIGYHLKNKYLFLSIAYAVMIFIVSSIPGDSLPKYDTLGMDKLLHFCVYFGFGILLFKTNGEQSKISIKTIFFLTLLIGLIYGISDEIHQLFVTNRNASVYDVIADFIGIFIGAVFIFKFTRKKVKNG